MLNNSTFLLWAVLFSCVGLGFFTYGRKQQAGIPMLCGVALMAYPYFVSTSWSLVLIGVVLVAVPFIFRSES